MSWLVSGTTLAGILNPLPGFGTSAASPQEPSPPAADASWHGESPHPVPVHLPAHHQICLRHGTWLSGPGTPQFSVSECPDIIAAERQARQLFRRGTAEQLIYAKVRAAGKPREPAAAAREPRSQALIESNPPAVSCASPQETLLAAGYPEVIIDTAMSLRTSHDNATEQSSTANQDPA